MASAVVKGSAVMDATTWEAAVLDGAGRTEPYVLHRLATILLKGLGKRVKLIGQTSWKQHDVSTCVCALSERLQICGVLLVAGIQSSTIF